MFCNIKIRCWDRLLLLICHAVEPFLQISFSLQSHRQIVLTNSFRKMWNLTKVGKVWKAHVWAQVSKVGWQTLGPKARHFGETMGWLRIWNLTTNEKYFLHLSRYQIITKMFCKIETKPGIINLCYVLEPFSQIYLWYKNYIWRFQLTVETLKEV